MDPFIAQIIMFAGNFAPRGWAYCDGQLMSIASNTALFSILGTTYGGDGRTTFALPDLRGRVPIHPGNGPGLSTRKLGQRAGTEFNTLTIAEMPSHTHSADFSGTASLNVNSSPGDHQTPAAGDSIAATAVPAGRGTDPANSYVAAAPSVTLNNDSIAISGSSIQIFPSGGGQSFNNMQPYACVNFIIALVGIYPSRS